MRRALLHPLAPVLAAAGAGLIVLLAAPATADMSAHTFRTWLWESQGSVLWNAQWYGGHHAAGYSLLFPPLAGLVGARAVGVIAGVAAVWAFGWLVGRRGAHTRQPERSPAGCSRAGSSPTSSSAACRSRSASPARSAPGPARCARPAAGSRRGAGALPRRAPAGALGVAAGGGQWGPMRVLMGSSLARPATVGVPDAAAPAVAVADSRVRVGWVLGAGALAFAATWASPVAGLFLCTAALGPAIAGGRTGRLRAAQLIGPACMAGFAIALAFPEGGPDRFVATAFWPMLALCAWSTLMLAERPREVRVAAVIYLALLAGAFVLHTPLGQNALRPGLLLGPSLLVLYPHPRAPRVLLVLAIGLLVYLQWLPAVRAVAEAAGDPATKRAFYAPLVAQLEPLARPGDRVEVPLTRNHWEAAYVAPKIPLARGWHRQLDREANGLFYGDSRLDAASYLAWLHAEAVRWVALPRAALDVSAEREARDPARRGARADRRLALAGLDRVGGRRLAPGRRAGAADRLAIPRASSCSPRGRAPPTCASTGRRTGR